MYVPLQFYLNNRYFLVRYGNAETKLNKIQAGVLQGSVFGPILYLLYTADLPTQAGTTISTFADDTAIIASHHNQVITSKNFQSSLNSIGNWLNKWRIKVKVKSIQIIFTNKHKTCPLTFINGVQIPQADETRYLGIYLDRTRNYI